MVVVVTAPTSVLERIRDATRPLYRALEQASPLMRPDVTPADYRWYLTKLLGFHAPVELMLNDLAIRHGLDLALAGRRKTPLIVQDLAALGLSPASPEAVPWSPWLPRPVGVGGLLGCGYVLEGATMRGKLLLRRLLPRLPELAGACRYLGCYGDAFGELWHAFLGLFRRHVATHADEDEAVAASCETFSSLGAWLAAASEAPHPARG
jgi:heme oxygenase